MGGSKSTTTISTQGDPVAQRMAQEISRQQWEMYQQVFMPYESELAAANRSNIPWNTSLARESIKSDLYLNPYRTEAQRMALEESMMDLERGRPIKDELNKLQMEALTASEGLAGKFFDAATKGVNTQDYITQQVGDLAKQQDLAGASAIRQAERMGVDPNSPRFQAMLLQQGDTNAAQRAGAITRARRGAEQQNLSNLALAMNAKNATQGLQGIGSMGAMAMGADQQQQGILNNGNFGLNSSLGGALAANQQAGQFGSSTSTQNQTSNPGFLNTALGIGSMIGGFMS